MPAIHGYHVHVYFDAATQGSAEALRKNILKDLAGKVRVYDLIDEPIGPHPLPMFEVDVPAENIDEVKRWLELNRGSHSILIHPLTGDDLADHRDFPQWLGTPLPLRLDILRRLRGIS